MRIPRYKILSGVGFLTLLLCIAHAYYARPTILETIASYLIWPALIIQNQCIKPVENYFKNRQTFAQLNAKYLDLEKSYQESLAKIIELQGMINFDQDCKELIDFKKQYDGNNALLAQIIFKQFNSQGHFFFIDKGAHAGIQKDMVAVFKNCLVGKVTEVYPFYSKLLLVSDQSCKVASYCANSKATGIYQGTSEQWSALLNHVSHLAHVEVGEMILSSGDGLVFPRGFGVGKIKSFKTDGLYHEVIIEPLINLQALNYCYIVQKGSS